jgi:hypothetical protein
MSSSRRFLRWSIFHSFPLFCGDCSNIWNRKKRMAIQSFTWQRSSCRLPRNWKKLFCLPIHEQSKKKEKAQNCNIANPVQPKQINQPT